MMFYNLFLLMASIYLVQGWINDDEFEYKSIVKNIFKDVRKKTSNCTKATTEPTKAKSRVNLNPTIVEKKSPDCSLANGERGECVSYYLCNNSVLNTDGDGLLDIRLGNDVRECDYLDVCCGLSNVTNTPKVVEPTTRPRTVKGCGLRNPEGTAGFRITGFQDATQYGEFPWIVAILREGEGIWNNKSYVASGSLISPRVALTAAHYVRGKLSDGIKMKVRAGEWDTNTKKERYPFQERVVVEIIVHEGFYSAGLYNDIALLILDEDITAAAHIGYVCLPKQGQKAKAGERCIAAGWGKDQFGSESEDQVIMKKVELPVVPNAECETALRKTRLKHQFKLHSSFMCAGGESDKDTCKGDGGAPLICPLDIREEEEIFRYTQNGIVSWGIDCGVVGNPGVYADVGQFRSWIDAEVSARSLDTTTYDH